MKRVFAVVLVLVSVAGCKPGAKQGQNASGNPACASGRVDLTKISGDWIASSTINDGSGSYTGDQYRVRFESVANGEVKARMAWRLDSRPFDGKIETTSLGQTLNLLETMSEDTINQLKKAGNQDPNLPMRASIQIAPSETGCQLDVTDNFQTFLGEKVIEKTSPIGTLKLVPAPSGPIYSFVRCEVQRGIFFDGKADEGGRPVVLTANKPTQIRAVAAKEWLKDAVPAGCESFDADVFVDGKRVAEKVPGKMGEEPGEDDKGKPIKVPSIIWEHPLALAAGPMHGVELHAYASCGERKLVASACNLASAQ